LSLGSLIIGWPTASNAKLEFRLLIADELVSTSTVWDDTPASFQKPPPWRRGESSQSLLAYLVLHRSAPQDRSHLAFLLWPEMYAAISIVEQIGSAALLQQAVPIKEQMGYL